MQEKVKSFIETTAFEVFIMVVIVINSVTLGIQTMDLPPVLYRILTIFDNFVLVIYTAEAILKLFAYRLSYFKDGWNVFDFIILVLCLLPYRFLPISPQVARIIRVFRAFKAFRLVSSFKSMRIVVEAIIKSIPGVISTAVLMFVIFYVYAVIGTVAFAADSPENFGTLGKSLYSLFQVMTLESWSEEICRPIMALYPIAGLYFITFIIISAFIMINVVIGIVIGAIDESQAKFKQEQAQKRLKKDPERESYENEVKELKAHLEALEKILEKQDFQ